MGVLRWVVVVAVAAAAWFVAYELNKTPPLPHLDPNPWWGPGESREQNTNVRRFTINISDEDLADLKARLSLPPRIASSLENTNFTYGVNSVTLGVLLKHWKDAYDWRAREKRLNAYHHFKTRIEGLDIHFLRASPAAAGGKIVRPLLLQHGWPGSIVEFYDIIPLLTTPRPESDIVFDVICPSLPGYGFSEAAAKPGMNTLAIAQVMVKLMDRLGFKQFYAQGGDWGSFVVTDIATVFPDKLLGIHLNMVLLQTTGFNIKKFLGAVLPSGAVMDPRLEYQWYPLSSLYGMLLRESGYAHIQATKPDTIGVALNSSPQGLAAYIFEKFSSYTKMENLYKPDGGLLDPAFPISLDAMLDNICIYWFTGSITSSVRLYAEFMTPTAPSLTLASIPTAVPTGIAAFLDEIVTVPRSFAAHKYYNIITYSNPSPGGHFAAMEVPKTLADDVFHFVNTAERLRSPKTKASSDKKSEKKKN